MATANNNIVRYNTAYNNGTLAERACGILFSSGTNNVSHNNIAYGNFAGFCLGWRGTRPRLYNNIAYQNTQYGVYAGQSSNNGSRIENNTVYNNTIYPHENHENLLDNRLKNSFSPEKNLSEVAL